MESELCASSGQTIYGQKKTSQTAELAKFGKFYEKHRPTPAHFRGVITPQTEMAAATLVTK